MKSIATVTSKGQITIPQVVRRLLGLRQGDRLEFNIEQGKVELRAAKPALRSAGVLKAHLPKDWTAKSPEEMDAAMARYFAQEHYGA